MPTRYFVPSDLQNESLERQDADIRLGAMHKAVAAGNADIEAGRYQDFDTAEGLREELFSLADEVIRGTTSGEDRT